MSASKNKLMGGSSEWREEKINVHRNFPISTSKCSKQLYLHRKRIYREYLPIFIKKFKILISETNRLKISMKVIKIKKNKIAS